MYRFLDALILESDCCPGMAALAFIHMLVLWAARSALVNPVSLHHTPCCGFFAHFIGSLHPYSKLTLDTAVPMRAKHLMHVTLLICADRANKRDPRNHHVVI